MKISLALVLAALAVPALAETPAKPAAAPAAGGAQYATFETSAGKIGVKLLTARAPKTVENFVGLASG
jgi:peptidyl-prolyl cis-trans isomerase A (cyclophilin A)